MKKVLVTGASGFIGRYVVRYLLNGHFHIIATSADEIKASQLDWYGKVEYIPFDFENFDQQTDYFRFFNEPDLVIHLAWEGLPNYRSAFHTDVNLPRHALFLQNLVEHGLRDLTVTGTCFEYGMQEGCLNENLEPQPGNSYAIAKNELRRELEQLQQRTPFFFKWIRLFYMYGKGQNPNSLLSQLDRALEAGDEVFNMSGGEQVRDFLPVEKVANYIVDIAIQNRIGGIVNCCSGKPVKVKDFVVDYLQQTKRSIRLNLGYYPYPDYEPMSFWGDNTKLKTIVSNE